MDWVWTIDRWLLAQAIQAHRLGRRTDDADWLETPSNGGARFDRTRIAARRIAPFWTAGLVARVGDDDPDSDLRGKLVWTAAGQSLFDVEFARRASRVLVR